MNTQASYMPAPPHSPLSPPLTPCTPAFFPSLSLLRDKIRGALASRALGRLRTVPQAHSGALSLCHTYSYSLVGHSLVPRVSRAHEEHTFDRNLGFL